MCILLPASRFQRPAYNVGTHGVAYYLQPCSSEVIFHRFLLLQGSHHPLLAHNFTAGLLSSSQLLCYVVWFCDIKTDYHYISLI